MLITIITPNLNYGRFLGDCLESVAEQMEELANDEKLRAGDAPVSQCGHQGCAINPPAASIIPQHSQTQKRAGRPRSLQIEHLVFDGGSTDESADVAARFPHVTWLQEADHGMSDAINKGFDRAKGNWVMWLNADDRLKPGALAEMLPFLEKSTADVVYGDWDFVTGAGDFLRHVKVPQWSRFVHVHHHCYVGSTAAFYRRVSVIEAGHRLREDFRYVMDGEFYARLDAAGMRFEHVPVTVADFRLHGENSSQRHLGMTRDMNSILAAERQHVESRSIRRAYGVTLFKDPYLNGLVDGVLWTVARAWKQILKLL